MRRAHSAVAGSALATFVASIHALMAHFVRAPIVLPDELGYIDGARHLALGGNRPITTYYPGLSIVLSPVWRFTHDPLTVWRAALAINCLLAGLTALVVWMSIPALGGTRARVLITLVVSAYPAVALYTNTALAESLLVFGAVGVVALACVAARVGRPPVWAALGLIAGLLVAVHPRGLAVVVAVVLAAWLHRRGRVLYVVGGATIGLALTRVALVAVRPSPGTGIGAYSASAVIGRAASLHGLVVGLAGQVFYLTVATAGLAPLGVVVGLRTRSFPLRVAALSSLGVLAMSVLFLNGGDRSDHVIYGRYNEGVVVAPLVIALAWLLSDDPSTRARRCLAWLGVGTAGLGVGAIALTLGLTDAQRHAPLNPSTVLAVVSILRRTGPGLQVAAIGACGAAALVLAVVLVSRVPRIALVALLTLWALVAGDAYGSYVRPGSVARAREDVLARTVALAAHRLHIETTCVGWDAGTDFTYFNDRFYLPGVRVEPVNGRVGATPCGAFVISDHPDFFSHYFGSQIVSVENDLDEILYVLPGPTMDLLRMAGWLLPATLPGPLPMQAQRARVHVIRPPATVRAGRAVRVRVTAVNAGAGTPWPNLRALKQTKYVVRLAVRWFRETDHVTLPGETGDVPVASAIRELPRTLLPGQHTTLTLSLDPMNLPPGRYVVVIAIYQELVGTMPGGSVSFPVTVLP